MKKTKRDILKESIKMHDVGQKSDFDGPCISSKGSSKYYPSLYLNIKQLPSLKSKDVSDSIKMIIEGEVVSHSKHESKRKGQKERMNEDFSIDVKKIGIVK